MWSIRDVAGKGGLTQWHQFPQSLPTEDAFVGTNVIRTTWWDIGPTHFRFLKSLLCSRWSQGDTTTMSATPFVQLDMGNQFLQWAHPIFCCRKQEITCIFWRGWWKSHSSEGLGVYSLVENISRNLSVIFLNSNCWKMLSVQQDIERPSSPFCGGGMLQHSVTECRKGDVEGSI